MKCVCCVQSQSVVGNIPQMRLRLERLELLLLLPPALSSLAEEGEEEEEAGGVGLGSGAGDPSPSGGAVGVMEVVVMVGLVLWCWLAGLCRELKVGKWRQEVKPASHSVNQRGQAIQWFRSHCLNYAYSVIEIAPFRHYGEGVTFFPGYAPCSFHAPAFHEASWPSVGWKVGPYATSTSGEVSAVSGDVLPPHAS